jgi:antirestriction protein ArdC
MNSATLPQCADLLNRALTEPGIVSKAYSAFHGYSIGNQLLALIQCAERGIAPGPISTFVGWRQKGRQVRKGEKAIVLCMPLTCKRRRTKQSGSAEGEEDRPKAFTRFVFRPHWFVLAQTEGPDVAQTSIPQWNRRRALETLGIVEEPFTETDGNCQGYARHRSIAVSPLAELPDKTRFHELAHVVLGDTSETDGLSESDQTPPSLREVEAEAVALICLEALGLTGAAQCRGYVQHWNRLRDRAPVPERSAQRVFKAADLILKAGIEPAENEGGDRHD